MKNKIDFVSLHNQTSYSLLDSLIEPKALLIRAKELGQTAVAITDHGSLAATWEAFKVSKEIDVKLIIGCECYFADDATNIQDKLRHVVFLATNAEGYNNLLTINKKGFDQGHFIGKRAYPIVDWKLMEKHAAGMICLTACGSGIINQLLMNKKFEEAEQTLLRLRDLFGDRLGLEVQPNNMKRGSNIFNDEVDQQFLNRRNIDLGKKHGIRVVPACNAHYLKKEESKTHDVFLAIGAHQPIFSTYRLRYPVSDFYLKTGEEVKAFFARNYGEDCAAELCANSMYFANLCEKPDWIDPKFSNPSGKELPIFSVKDELDYAEFRAWVSQQSEDVINLDEDKQYLRFKCLSAFEKLKQNDIEVSKNEKVYLDRINEELDVLEYQGFSSYLLIVADYVNWCCNNKIPVGPGRGSVAGCFLAYLLGIHSADSIKYGLLFARFQNKSRTNYPDIDQDVSTVHREAVIDYIRQKYGSDNVCAISNYNRITPKVYVRDVSRACEFGGSKEIAVEIGNNLASMISSDYAYSSNIDTVVKNSPLLAEYCKKYPEVLECRDILGLPRAASQHAAGLIISQRSLVGLVPLRSDSNKNFVIEYDKDLSEENGFVKMDVLGLSTLDIIQKALSIIKARGHDFPKDYDNYDLNDQKTYELISAGDTFGVFQLGTSSGTIDLCKRIKPKNIEDLAVITTLARPAASDIRNDFIATREGKKKMILLHPKLEGAFQKTYGFGLFDESILQLGRDVAGWDLNSADRIRKMIKEKGKNPDKDRKLRDEFISGAIKNGIEPTLAVRIWDEEIRKFASYTFNKSHAVVYSMVSYQTAYLKAHYPIEFLLANLMAESKSNSPDAKSNIEKFKKEIRAHRVKILPPDINTSQLTYTLNDNKILTGLDALKFVGVDGIKDIIEKRPFTSFLDFMARVSSKKVRSNNIQALVAAGAMDSFKIPRKLIFLYCSDFRKKLSTWMKRHDPQKEEFIYPWPKESDWKISELYALEQYYLGEAFVCKPPDAYGDFFKGTQKLIYEVKKSKDKTRLSPIKGIVRNFFAFKVKKEGKYYGRPMVKSVIEDKNGDQCGLTIFPDRWEEVQKRIKEINSKSQFDVGIALEFAGTTNNYEDEIGLILDDLFNIATIPALPPDLKAKQINMKLDKKEKSEKKDNNVEGLLEEMEETLYNEGLIDLEEEVPEDDED